jgi:hypothetical protein
MSDLPPAAPPGPSGAALADATRIVAEAMTRATGEPWVPVSAAENDGGDIDKAIEAQERKGLLALRDAFDGAA